MKNTLKLILRNHIINRKVLRRESGFTLLELLMGVVIAFIVITPLMGFMISIMNTDRQEQAKSTSEQEIQIALDYIARDLQQAIYIYDSTGITALTSTANNGPQIPTDNDRVPVLVFWKREAVSQVIPTASGNDDAFIYSLVIYYLMKSTSSTWSSNAAQIARWEISDGVNTSSTDANTTTTCGNRSPIDNTNPVLYTRYITNYCPDAGFAAFKFAAFDNLEQGMNKWKKHSSAYTASTNVLVDFIDQTTTGAPSFVTCSGNSVKVPPDNFNAGTVSSMTSFYACVDKTTNTAQVFIRGNSLARIETNVNNLNYSDDKKSYFPTASINVQGKSYLFR
jgi:type II secretory pathway pseudopilin PulG